MTMMRPNERMKLWKVVKSFPSAEEFIMPDVKFWHTHKIVVSHNYVTESGHMWNEFIFEGFQVFCKTIHTVFISVDFSCITIPNFTVFYWNFI